MNEHILLYFSRYRIIAKVQKRCISNVNYFLYYAMRSHLIDTDDSGMCTYYKFFHFFTFLEVLY